jgi:hypothetical protein
MRLFGFRLKVQLRAVPVLSPNIVPVIVAAFPLAIDLIRSSRHKGPLTGFEPAEVQNHVQGCEDRLQAFLSRPG